ncbi:MAG: rod shape-determining protein MreD [Candidatus Omnitrophica bacterium]|jgi:rod shape-determining protein MreD|nr:rod shape-determining protein MreD [Candidatus Omnitrophota bacterium]MDD3987775.1 rod shape-determining protein MreD [Candidatus Omnitrophota bacterium]MDD4981852.1 rod shape-determining protein MreD [Candidatus Omnitrophota bacterium]MDD5665023.1 rod shape-determining protein MreD [Candidatus Omnitrophota bacterium]
MRPQSVFILTALFALLQITILEHFKFFGVRPDLLMVAVFTGAVYLRLKPALAVGLFAGIFKDVFSLHLFGVNAVLLPLWVLLIANLVRRVSIEDNLSRTLFILAVALLNNLIIGLTLVYAGVSLPLGIFTRILILSSIYTALCFYLTVRVMAKWAGLR